MKPIQFDIRERLAIPESFGPACRFVAGEATIAALESRKLKVNVTRAGVRRTIDTFDLELNAVAGNIKIMLRDNGNKVVFGQGSSGAYDIRLRRESLVSIGPGSTSNGARIVGDISSFTCGRDCMLSDSIIVQTSDQHGLVDLATGEIVNTGETSVHLGDHVWVGRTASLLHGCDVGDGCVIGFGALVRDRFEPCQLIVGSPARTVRSGITWTRKTEELDAWSAQAVQAWPG